MPKDITIRHRPTKYVFENIFREYDDDKENNIIDYSDQERDYLRLQLDFKYYQNHEFHKQSQTSTNNKTLSILHTSICSLEDNTEKFETFISNFKFNFDVIAVSETWASSSGENIKPRIIDGCQTYHETKGHTLKSRCEFYVKNGLKYCQRTDLDLIILDKKHEFQFRWIEITNNPNPNTMILQASQEIFK